MAASSVVPLYKERPHTEVPLSEFPYSEQDLSCSDATSDEGFYSSPRFVTHIDDNAIAEIGRYYGQVLPKKGAILDLCSSWISHFPKELAEIATRTARGSSAVPSDDSETATGVGPLEVTGIGMNRNELDANPVLKNIVQQNLNKAPELQPNLGPFDAVTCVVSIEYLTSPLQVLTSVRSRMNEGAYIHLIISDRCFPTKAIKRWLMVDQEARLNMIADFLLYSGYKDIVIVTLVDPSASRLSDPLRVVRGRKRELRDPS